MANLDSLGLYRAARELHAIQHRNYHDGDCARCPLGGSSSTCWCMARAAMHRTEDEFVDFIENTGNARHWIEPQSKALQEWYNKISLFSTVVPGTEPDAAPTVCSACGVVIEEGGHYFDIDRATFCLPCFETKYFICEDCGEVHERVDLHKVTVTNNGYNDAERNVCGNCLDRGLGNGKYFECSDCGKFYAVSLIRLYDDDHNICYRCSDEWAECAECNCLGRRDAMFYSRRSGDYYCQEHSPDDEDSHIHGYSHKPSPVFHSTDDENASGVKLFMGVELEIDNGKQYGECQRQLHGLSDGENLLYLKHDGSLNEYGIEIVTHPCTLPYHMTQFPWEDIITSAKRCGYRSHDTSTCGMHVHVSRNALGTSGAEQEATAAKIILMVDRFWDKLSTFARRDLNESRWACKPNANIAPGDNIDVAIQKSKRNNHDRYRAINLTNSNTIEFRIFKGSLELNTIKASMQMVGNFCTFAKENDLNTCLNADWLSVINYRVYDEMTDYLASRGLNNNN